MKLNQTRRGLLLAALAGTCLLSITSQAATIIVGRGNDTSYFVLQSPNLGERTYEVNYTYNSSAAQDGFFLLNQIIAADATTDFVVFNFGSMAAPNYFLNSLSSGGITETNTSASPFAPYWAHWVAGGQAGFPAATPNPSGTWSLGSGISAPYRLIEPGSWDGLFYSDGLTAPSVVPIPETSSAVLTLLGAMVLFKRRRSS